MVIRIEALLMNQVLVIDFESEVRESCCNAHQVIGVSSDCLHSDIPPARCEFPNVDYAWSVEGSFRKRLRFGNR